MPTGTKAKITNANVADAAAIVQTKIALTFGVVGSMVAETPDVAASAGVSTTIAPIDHVHAAGCGTAGAIAPDDTAAEGSATSFARSDHVHGFTCAAPGTTTLADAAGEGSATSSARSDHKHLYMITGLADCRLLWDSTTQTSLNGLSATSKRVEINGAYLSLASPIVCLTTDNLLTAAGADSGGAMAANTTYYMYQSNGSASPFASDLRGSATAPTSGYLAASGNGANWRHVGWVHTDASTQFTDRFSVCSLFYGEPHSLNVFQGTSATQAIGAAAWTDINGLAKYVLLPPGWSVNLIAHITAYHDDITQTFNFACTFNSVYGGGTSDAPLVASKNRTITVGQFYENATTSPIWAYGNVQGYTSAVNFTVLGTASDLQVQIIPRHN